MRTSQRKERGFTLPELMVAMVVFSLIMVLVGTILRGEQEQTNLAGIKMNLEESVRESLYRMGQEIRETAPNRATINPTRDVIQFCVPNSATPINNRCRLNCTAGVAAQTPCNFNSVNACVNNCNTIWDANWKGVCNIDCNALCNGYCNADYNVNWKDSLRLQYGLGRSNNRQLIRTDTVTGQTTVMANDIQSVTFTASGNPTATITYAVTAQRTMINGRVLPVASTGETKLRNN